MLNYPRDPQPVRNEDFERLGGPARPIEPGARLVSYGFQEAPFIHPPGYRRISPGPPGYVGPPAYDRYAQSAALAPLLGPPPGYGHRIQLPPLHNPAFERLPNVYVPRGVHTPPRAPAPVPGPVLAPRPVLAPAPRPAHDDMDVEPPVSNVTRTNADSDAKPYTIMATYQWTEMVQPRSGSRGRPSKEVKSEDTKLIHLDLDGIPRHAVIRALFRAHKMDQDMMISALRGPQLKVSWKGKGAGAGKNYSCTVDDNEEWEQVRDVILKLDPNSTPVSISFHADDLRNLRKRTRVEPDEGFDEIGRAGANYKVSRADFPTETPDTQVLQGRKLQELETALQCMTHEGEHGGPGQCWKRDDGSHVAMNMRRKKIWVAAIHAQRADLANPPDIPEFTNPDPRFVFPPVTDVPATGPSGSRSRRATRSQAALAPAPVPAHNDTISMVSALTAGMVSALSANMGRVPNPPALAAAPVVAPVPAPAPAPEPAQPPPIRTPSPIPNATPRDLILASVAAFHVYSGLDLSGQQNYLVENELTPSLVSHVPFHHLADHLHVPGGHAIQYQLFCEEWNRKYQAASRN